MTPSSRKRNRAAQDATLINVRALQKRVKSLEESVDILWDLFKVVDRKLEKRPARRKGKR